MEQQGGDTLSIQYLVLEGDILVVFMSMADGVKQGFPFLFGEVSQTSIVQCTIQKIWF